MKNLFLLGLLVLLLVAVQFASAQTVDDIIDKYINAIGGKDKLLSIKSIYMEGSRDMMGNEVTVRITKEQGKLSRAEFEMGSTNGFILVTTKEAWRYIPMRTPSPVKLSDEETAAMQPELNIFPLFNYVENGSKTELLGRDSLNGTECYKIKVTTSTGKIISYWIDSNTYFLAQSSQQSNRTFGGRKNNGDNSPASNSSVEIIALYKDYSPIDGIQIAHTIEIKGEMGGSTTFDKIELNIPVDAKLYKPE